MATSNTHTQRSARKTQSSSRKTQSAAGKTIKKATSTSKAGTKKTTAKTITKTKTVAASRPRTTTAARKENKIASGKNAATPASSKSNKTNANSTNSKSSTSNKRSKSSTTSKTRDTKNAFGKNMASKKRDTLHSKHCTVTTCVVTGIVCIFIGLLVGFYLLGSGFTMVGRTSISEAELDQPVGIYIINGVPNFISAREVLDSGNGLSQSLQEDGTYAYPTAEEVLAAVRTAVLNGEVTARGITISDEDMKEYAEQQLGTSDYSHIANYYGLDEASVQTFVRQAVGINKLRQEITGVADQLAPTAPEQGLDAASYKSYILHLLGDNWDVQNNAWANEDNDYYEALSGDAFNPDTATYEQASMVYSIASENYQADSAAAANTWNDYVNDVLKNCQVRIGEAIL